MDEETLKQLEGRGEAPFATSPDGEGAEDPSPEGHSTSTGPPPDEQLMPPPSIPSSENAQAKAVSDTPAGTGSRGYHADSGRHQRSMSLADFVLNSKRLSLNLPPSARDGNSTRSPRPPSWASSPLLTPTGESSPPHGRMNQPTIENNFLTALAAQERRVLELKEELGRAEGQLEKLKQQWAQYEGQRKRQTDSGFTKLQPLAVPLSNVEQSRTIDDPDGEAAWMQREMARRRQLLGGAQRGNRKVFSGGRHARTLSLLSPDRSYTPSFPQSETHGDHNCFPAAKAAATDPELNEAQAAEELWIARSSLDLSLLPSDALLKTGKQVASGIRDGLWTFFEDIRQATIGEEPITGNSAPHRPSTRHARSKTSPYSLKKHGSRQSLARSSVSSTGTATILPGTTQTDRPHSENPDYRPGLSAPDIVEEPYSPEDVPKGEGSDERAAGSTSEPMSTKTRQEKTPRRQHRPASLDSEAWDTWGTQTYGDSASPQDTSATSASETNGESLRSTPRTSTSSASVFIAATSKDTPRRGQPAHRREASSVRDAIPWPALSKFTPTQLKRTASNLMSEWERSLTPSPSREATLLRQEDSADYVI